MSGFAHETPVTMPAECRPIELNNTYVFTENVDTAEFLSGLGYKLLTRAEGKSLRKKELAKASRLMWWLLWRWSRWLFLVLQLL